MYSTDSYEERRAALNRCLASGQLLMEEISDHSQKSVGELRKEAEAIQHRSDTLVSSSDGELRGDAEKEYLGLQRRAKEIARALMALDETTAGAIVGHDHEEGLRRTSPIEHPQVEPYVQPEQSLQEDELGANRKYSRKDDLRHPITLSESDVQSWHRDSHPITKKGDGSPKVWYHASRTEPTESFKSVPGEMGLHVGSARQANNRAWATTGANYEGAHVYPVHVHSRSPIRVPDGGSWDSTFWSRMASKVGGVTHRRDNGEVDMHHPLADYVTEGERSQLQSLSQDNMDHLNRFRQNLENDRKARDIAKAAFMRAGHDSLVYHNGYEGDSDSMIVFHPHQVKSAHNKRPTGSDNINLQDITPATSLASVKRVNLVEIDHAKIKGTEQDWTKVEEAAKEHTARFEKQQTSDGSSMLDYVGDNGGYYGWITPDGTFIHNGDSGDGTHEDAVKSFHDQASVSHPQGGYGVYSHKAKLNGWVRIGPENDDRHLAQFHGDPTFQQKDWMDKKLADVHWESSSTRKSGYGMPSMRKYLAKDEVGRASHQNEEFKELFLRDEEPETGS